MDVPTWQEALQEFLLLKRAEGRAPRTIRDYRRHVPAFFDQFPDAWPETSSLRHSIVEHFASLSENSPSYYNLRREYLKSFFSFCVSEGYLDENPVEGLQRRRNEGRPRHLSEDELRRLLELPRADTFAGVRDRALILFQVDSGARPAEALAVLPEHVDLGSLEVYIPPKNEKARRGRTVVISPATAKAIRKLLSVRPPDWDVDVPVFCSTSGTKLNVDSWTRRLIQYGKTIGVNVSPYRLRHSHAIMFLRNGGNLFALQRQMGHSDISTTKHYVNLSNDDLHEEHAKASPVSSLVPQRSRVGKIQTTRAGTRKGT